MPRYWGVHLDSYILYRVTFSIILMDESGTFLDSQGVLELLQETEALMQLREQGFRVTGFSALQPQTELTSGMVQHHLQ